MRAFFIIITILMGFYFVQGKVIDNRKDTSLIETPDGNVWEWLDNTLPKGRVFMLMHNNGTKDVEDDIILGIFNS